MHVSEYREAWDPETRASRAHAARRGDEPGIRAHGNTPHPARPSVRRTEPRDEWADMYASPIDTPDWTNPGTCQHKAIRERSIGGVLTNRSCIDCSAPLPNRDFE